MTTGRVPHKPLRLRRLLLIYISALIALSGSVFASMTLTELETSRLAEDAAFIDSSARQRMLSQRIIYLAQDLSAPEGAPTGSAPRDGSVVAEQLESAIAEFETAHLALSSDARLPDHVYRAYFGASAGPSLDERIKTYIATARDILSRPGDATLLERLYAVERGGLLDDLDQVVRLLLGHSLERITHLRDIERYILIFAIAIVAYELVFVFLPGHRAISRTLDTIRRRNVALVEARRNLRTTNADLSAQKNRIERAALELRAALKESEALRSEQSQFTYAVSHDLKSPANTLHLLLNEISLDHYEGMTVDGRKLLETAQGTVRRMTRLIDDMLTYSWVTDAGSEKETFDMGECLSDVVMDLSSDIAEADAQVFVSGAFDVTGYATQLRILAQNLISNAIKFRDKDSGVKPVVRVSCHRVDDAGTWRLVVQDNGIGIPKEYQSRIFKLFERLHLQSAYPGSGLGLSTCQRIVANHRGKVTLISAPGAGSTFDVTLRAPQAEDEKPKHRDLVDIGTKTDREEEAKAA